MFFLALTGASPMSTSAATCMAARWMALGALPLACCLLQRTTTT